MTESATNVGQLPRGRHGLPRDQVVASQRNRILNATARAMAENGYSRTSVAVILKGAGVSRETFYEQFRSKEDCFEAAYERALQQLLARLIEVRAAGAELDLQARISWIFDVYLRHLADDPASARLFLVEVYAVGSAAIARRTELQHLFVDLLIDTFGAHSAAQQFACQSLVAATSAMVTGRIAVGDLDGLLELREPMLELVYRGGTLYGDNLATPEEHKEPEETKEAATTADGGATMTDLTTSAGSGLAP